MKKAATPNARHPVHPAGRGARHRHQHRKAGAIRPDAGASALFALVTAAAWVREQVSEVQSERLLRIMLDGLRPQPTR